MARSGMDKDLPREVACEMPYLAVIHPWNSDRIKRSNLQFFSAAKIIKMIAKEEFKFDDKVVVKKGEVIEYVGNLSEGDFSVRIGGKLYRADQSLWKFVDRPGQDQFIEDDWVPLTCWGGARAYIYLDDVRLEATPYQAVVPGISAGDAEGYGHARDLTEEEAAVLENVKATKMAFADYEHTWFWSKGWSGEYPPGFSVTKSHITVMARSAMVKDMPREVACELPYLAVIHPGNPERIRKSDMQFFSATKIIKMIAKEEFDFGDDVEVKKGERIEYIRNLSEGDFSVRINGETYTADQSLWEFVDKPSRDQFVEEDWVLLTCQGGNLAYIFLDDVRIKGPNHTLTFPPGISMAESVDGGQSRDLTEQEAAELEKEKAAGKLEKEKAAGK
jgi:hypothetical protein